MNKTFKSAHSNRIMSVEELPSGNVSVTVGLSEIRLDKETAVESAFAQIHAAYPTVVMTEDLSKAKEFLLSHISNMREATAEAKEQAELEAEALNYWKTFQKVTSPTSFDVIQWGILMPETQAKWLAVARKARELNKELTNGR